MINRKIPKKYFSPHSHDLQHDLKEEILTDLTVSTERKTPLTIFGCDRFSWMRVLIDLCMRSKSIDKNDLIFP